MIVGRRAVRREQAERHGRLVARNGLGDGRHVGELRHALLAAEAQHVELAGLDRRQRDRRAHGDHVDVAGDQIVQRGRRAAIMHRRELDAGEAFQQQRAGVRRGADAGGAVGHAAGLLPWRARSTRPPTSPAPTGSPAAPRNAGVARDRDEIGLRVVGQLALGVEMRLAGDEAGLGGQQRVAVVSAARLTAVAAKLWPAPPRFSTTMAWPHICDSRWLTARVSTSVSAPAAEVTTMVTVRFGIGLGERAGTRKQAGEQASRAGSSGRAGCSWPPSRVSFCRKLSTRRGERDCG